MRSIAEAFRKYVPDALVDEIIGCLTEAQRPMAVKLLAEMNAGNDLELFSHEHTWRFVIREIHIESDKTVKIKMLGE